MRSGEVLRLVAAQGGVVSRAQLRRAGVSDDMIRRDVRRGVWEPEGRSALVVPETERDLATLTRILAINHPSLVPTGASAVALDRASPFQQLIRDQNLPWMIGPRDERWFGITHHGVRTVLRGGIEVACDVDALVDLLRFLPVKRAQRAAMRAVQIGMVSVPTLRAAAADLVGYPGARQLREVILAIADGAQSEGERRLQAILRDAGVRGWRANQSVYVAGRRVVIDICFLECGVAVEFDGWAYHSDPESFQRDRERQNILVSAGWIVLRFTWDDLGDPEAIVSQIKGALTARSMHDRFEP